MGTVACAFVEMGTLACAFVEMGTLAYAFLVMGTLACALLEMEMDVYLEKVTFVAQMMVISCEEVISGVKMEMDILTRK
uniref:Uncharacterized protein n=1 Tax=Zea mays TaxID=4577 RepID=A0A804R9H3_MAIZE